MASSRGGGYGRFAGRGRDEVLVFVDNLPIDMNPKWLRRIFNWFGRVTDVFIPKKVRAGVGTRFAFVRFERRSEAMSAVRRCNGAFMGRFRMAVKLASYERNKGVLRKEWRVKQIKEIEVEKDRQREHSQRDGADAEHIDKDQVKVNGVRLVNEEDRGQGGSRTYAEVVKGVLVGNKYPIILDDIEED
ncbi:hypothetical protein L1049_021127 [Liquidambar formosana]|uniref:RRM domain-containing protein n=1 Tax=Liquidambar formosana TaxID=63359 RepID=A0AAP0X6P5_LIQFO